MVKFLLLSLLLCSVGCKPQIKQGDAVWLKPRPDAGMFAELVDVLSVLECYDTGFCSGAKIDFGTGGVYFDQSKGPNWFNYYFSPLVLGNTQKTYFVVEIPSHNGLRNLEVEEPSRFKINYLIKKYVKIRPEIVFETNQFAETHFLNSFIIGIHYRGTDKGSEAPAVKYENVVDEVLKQIQLHHLERYKIFIATDEYDFLEYMKAQFPGKIVYLQGVERSKDGKPLHMGKDSGQYEQGKQALMDSVLLSKTDFLIRTSSNLSLFSTYLNPKLPVFELSKRY